MLILDIITETNDFFNEIYSILKNIWNIINNFLLQYMTQDVINIFGFTFIIIVILSIALAIINQK